MIDVFISYAHEDLNRFVRPLLVELRRCGISFWLDRVERRERDSLPNYLEQGIRISKFTLVFMSNSYVGREWTEYELKTALKLEEQAKKIIIIPILFDNEKFIYGNNGFIKERNRFLWQDGPIRIANSLHVMLFQNTVEIIKSFKDSELFYYLENVNDYGSDIHGRLYGGSVTPLLQAEIISRGLASQYALELYDKGISLIANGDIQTACKKFKEAANDKKSKNFIAAFNNLGAASLDLDRFAAAEYIYKEKLKPIQTFYICKNRIKSSFAIDKASIPDTKDLLFIFRDLILAYRYIAYINKNDQASQYLNAYNERCIELAFVFKMPKKARIELQLSANTIELLPIIYEFIIKSLPPDSAKELTKLLLVDMSAFLITEKDLSLIQIAYELESRRLQKIACVWYEYLCASALIIAKHSIQTIWSCFRYTKCLWSVGDLETSQLWLQKVLKLYHAQSEDLNKDSNSVDRKMELEKLKANIDEFIAKVAI